MCRIAVMWIQIHMEPYFWPKIRIRCGSSKKERRQNCITILCRKDISFWNVLHKKTLSFFCLCLNKTSTFTHAHVPVIDRYPKILFYSPFFTFGHCPFCIFFYKIFLQLLPEIYLTSRLLAGRNFGLCYELKGYFWYIYHVWI